MPVTVRVDDQQVRVGLGDLRAGISNPGPLLNIFGELMRASVKRTFREEGSPAGSWPRLALSTLRKKVYTSGHKLLILSGRLFGSITYAVSGNTLTIGTNLVYAGVHQFGSADYRGGTMGPLGRVDSDRYDALRMKIAAHGSGRIANRQYGRDLRTDKNGKLRLVRVKIAGPLNRSTHQVSEHFRSQNIPARPFLVVRPEDPQRLADGAVAYLGGKMVRIGMVGAR